MDNFEQQKELFKMWFAASTELAGIILLAMLVWCPVPKINEPIANIALGFITATVIGTPIAYFLGGNPAGKKPDSQVTVTGDSPTVPVTTNNPPALSKDDGVVTYTTDDK